MEHSEVMCVRCGEPVDSRRLAVLRKGQMERCLDCQSTVERERGTRRLCIRETWGSREDFRRDRESWKTLGREDG